MKHLTVSLVSLACLALPGLAACGPKKPEPIMEVAATTPPPDPNAWRAAVPKPGPEGKWTAPAATRFTLSNGIPVYLVKQGDLPGYLWNQGLFDSNKLKELIGTGAKRERATMIARYFQPGKNTSKSFEVFITGVGKLQSES